MRFSALITASLLWYAAMNAAHAATNPLEKIPTLGTETGAVLMIAPSASDYDLEVRSQNTGFIFKTKQDCQDVVKYLKQQFLAQGHIDENAHLWCKLMY